jgi:diguanylate cyclase (GGDEF)-like protein
MATGNPEQTGDSLRNIHIPYYNDKLLSSGKYIQALVMVSALINLFLLIPDVSLIESLSGIYAVIFVRTVYCLGLLGVLFATRLIKTFIPFSIVVTACELAAFLVFLFVYHLYRLPDFTIQTMGLMILIIVVFYVPNLWLNMIAVSLLGSAGYFASAFICMEEPDSMELWAAVTYVSLAILLCALNARNTELHQFREYKAKCELERLSSTDHLTNAANRFKMEEEAERWIRFCRRQGFPLALVFIDVDNLKKINDQYGHTAGDSVLSELSALIQRQLRSSDILARWGGDEFIMLLPNVTLENAVKLTERVRNQIREHTFIHGVIVTCSFGVVSMKEDASFENMVHEADESMYSGKKKGKDSVYWACNP